MDNDFATGYALGADSNSGNGNGGNGGWGGAWEGIWGIIILAMVFGWGNGGWGGFGGGNGAGVQGAVTRSDLCSEFAFNNLDRAVTGIQQGLCDGFYAQNTNLLTGLANTNTNIMQGFNGVSNAICTLGYQNQAGFNALSNELASCCCQTQRAIDGVNYNMATNTCALQTSIANSTRDIVDSQQAGTRAILDYLCQQETANLRSENQALKLAASQQAQNNYLVNTLRPTPQPAYLTCNPYTGQYGYGYAQGCGCNSGCGC